MWARKHLAVLLVLASMTVSVGAAVVIVTLPPRTGLLPFATYGELANYLGSAQSSSKSSGYGSGLIAGPARSGQTMAPIAGAPSYSGTNVQVAGVDELDRVKTDGTYLYVTSQDEVAVFLAYPASELHLVTRIPLANVTRPLTGSDNAQAVGLFLSGSKLLVVADAYASVWAGTAGSGSSLMLPPTAMLGRTALWTAPQMTLAILYDVSDPSRPSLEHTLAITGYASTGPMVGSSVYLVASQWIPEVNGTYLPPTLCVDGSCRDLAPAEIYHDPESVDAWDYTNLLALDLETGAAKPMSLVTGGSSILYMSPNALYLAFFKWAVEPMRASPLMTPVRADPGRTTIYKLEAEGLDIAPVASADVAGNLLGQYSMDEWNGSLRVATTARTWSANGSSVSSDVYAFDSSLVLLGSVTNLAPGESIFAVRFLEDRAYVVTFRKIDPLFVIDLSDPVSPHVSGFLEMPGFSQYLYPINSGHLVGVGKDALPAEGNFSWYQGLKLSLYDVTNGSDPKETSNVSIGDRGTQSEVLYDAHAFLSIPDRGLIVLPVDLAIIDPTQYPDGVPPWAYGDVVWQGAYVFQVNATAGFTYVGRVAHANGTVNATTGWYGSPSAIHRSLYIGDVLYTVSDTEVLASSLADLSEIAHVVYASPTSCWACGPVTVA